MNYLIEANNLSYAYGRKPVLQDIAFHIEAGEPVALVGPNGAGKTTLFSLLCGYLPLQKGQLKVCGQAAGSSALIGRVGALPQDAIFDPSFDLLTQLSFFGQLQGMSRKVAQDEARRVLGLVDLAEQASQLPTALSHGMRKRLAIAQALLGRPELILLDEPTAGLDPANAMQIRELISNLSQQATFIISSHNLFELERLCSKVLYLEKGRLVPASSASANPQVGYLSVMLDAHDSSVVMPFLQQIPGVLKVLQRQKNEYQLTYQADAVPDFDIQLLSQLHQLGIRYRQVNLGQTLEQQLFSLPARSA